MTDEKRTIILTITKKYFDLILSGEKTVEYRKDIPYYDKRFSPTPDIIIFHYRKKIYLYCKISRIRKITRPATLSKSVFITTPKCFAVEIKSARLIQ